MEINKAQIAKIHALKSQLKLSDEEYSAALGSYGVTTSKDLSYEQASDLIKKLVKLLPQYLEYKEKKKYKKYDELGIRWNEKLKQHYATPKQLRMLEAMWMTSPRVENKTEDAFRKFCKRITGIDRIEWLMMNDVRKIKKAIENL
ncbi:regulatory protein GemA [Rosettibacter firmus]|uniref:regulatory protein GemA n=1 Tax=Rosettibacter firmus TaxID=3111522 RepID=UPI00317AB8FC